MIFEVLTLIFIKEKQMSEIANLGSTQLSAPKNKKPTSPKAVGRISHNGITYFLSKFVNEVEDESGKVVKVATYSLSMISK